MIVDWISGFFLGVGVAGMAYGMTDRQSRKRLEEIEAEMERVVGQAKQVVEWGRARGFPE
jgi:hypothetical protein